MKLQFGATLPGGPMRAWHVSAVFLPFLLAMLYPVSYKVLGGGHPLLVGPWLFAAIFLPLVGLVVAACVIGMVGGFPLWALPALGVLLFFAGAMLQWFAQAVVFVVVMIPFYGGWPGNFRLGEDIAMMLLVQAVFLVLMAALAAGLLRLVPGFRARVRQEWTLLSFLLYGIAILPVLGNDEYHGIEGYEVAALLILAVGAGLYLLAPQRRQRVLALVLPAILSPVVMSLALYQAFPSEAWADPASFTFRVWEALQPVLYLLPLPFMLLLAKWIGSRGKRKRGEGSVEGRGGAGEFEITSWRSPV